MAIIIYLVSRLRKLEVKKEKAEEVIKVLKDEEKVLEGEIEKLSDSSDSNEVVYGNKNK